ncbi:MAG: hypothetical protein KDM63_00655 [Verrucomicrobiae bacterium]|nr:hypothetical protein [Verrucomicrobiae bacterium]MCB1085527.1 hypothetical protein [Verrucomicrobiae bacterium]MCB1091982.1 hypothetical protein [Verrucomicrobiae bacterium]
MKMQLAILAWVTSQALFTVGACGETPRRLELDVNWIIDSGWFGTGENPNVTLNGQDSLSVGLKALVKQEIDGKVGSVLIMQDRGGGLVGYEKLADNEYKILLARRDSKGELSRNVRQFLKTVIFLGGIDKVEKARLEFINGEIDQMSAIRRLLKNDYLIMKKAEEFGRNVWAQFCKDNLIDPRLNEWITIGDQSFEKWMQSDTGKGRSAAWENEINANWK